MAGNKAILQRLYDEAFTGRDLDVIDELVAEDMIEHQEFPGVEPGRAGLKQVFALTHSAFPDFRMAAERMVEEGDTVVVWARMTGTHEGEFLGIPASGNQLDLELADWVRLHDGRIAEHWGILDSLVMMQQLGAMPPPPGP